MSANDFGVIEDLRKRSFSVHIGYTRRPRLLTACHRGQAPKARDLLTFTLSHR